MLQAWACALTLHVVLPQPTDSCSLYEGSDLSAFTRYEPGQIPSLLDFTVTSDASATSQHRWLHAPGDHAYVAFTSQGQPPRKLAKFKRTTWRLPPDEQRQEEARDRIAEFIPQEGFETFAALHKAIVDFQHAFGDTRTKQEKRAQKESEYTKALRRELNKYKEMEWHHREMECPEVRAYGQEMRAKLSGMVWNAHVADVEEYRTSQKIATVKRGGTLHKNKKLYPLKEMIANDTPEADAVNAPRLGNQEKIQATREIFTQKWCTEHDDGSDYEVCTAYLRDNDEVMIGGPPETHASTLEKAKNPHKLDHYGVSGLAMWFMLKCRAFRQATHNFVTQVVGSNAMMQEAEMHGFVQAKTPKPARPAQTRAILRMPWALRLCHGHINALLEKRIVETTVYRPQVYDAGGSRGTSTDDVSLSCQLMVEKGLDNRSKFSLASEDVQGFFDNVPLGRLAMELRHRGIDSALGAAAIRLHIAPTVKLYILGEECQLPQRKKGLLTGCSNAALLQRLPVQSAISENWQYLQERAATFETEDGPISFAAAYWSDNIFTFGRSANAAMEIAASIEASLTRSWAPLRIAADSKEVLVLPGAGEDSEWQRLGFQRKSTIKVLGSHIQANAGTQTTFDVFKKKVMTAYWTNLHTESGISNAELWKSRLRLFGSVTTGMLVHWSTPVPMTATTMQKLDKLQADLAVRLCPYKKLQTTSWKDWEQARRNWLKGKLKRPWSLMAAKRQDRHYMHCMRHREKWPATIMAVQRPQQLKILRQANWSTIATALRNSETGRTNTRMMRERVCARHSEAFARRNPSLAKFAPLGDKAAPQRSSISDEQVDAWYAALRAQEEERAAAAAERHRL